MAEKDKASKAAVVVSIGAAVTAAFALLQKRVKAAPLEPSQIVGLDEATMNLLIAIAQASGNIDSNTLDALAKLQEIVDKIGVGVPGGQGWPPNANSITSLRVVIAVGGTQLPYIAVPSGMSLVIKAWPLNPGWLQIGATLAECASINQSFPLLPSEVVGYQVENADQIFIAATVAGCFACLTVEQRKGGG